MKLRLSRNNRRWKALAAGGFAFFLVKGLVWLAIGAFATAQIV